MIEEVKLDEKNWNNIDVKAVKPLLHIDFHGKYATSKAGLWEGFNWDIDVGCMASRYYWDWRDKPHHIEEVVQEMGNKIDQLYENI